MAFLKITIFLFSFLFAININAQKVNFKNYSTTNGLPQSDVVDAVQDTIGYVWFATQGGGIARFDGSEFKVFNQKNGLLSNFTNALFIKKDSLFIGTNKGLSIKVKNGFANFKTPKINKILLLDKKVYLTTTQGVYQFSKDYVFPIKIDLKIDLANVIDIKKRNGFYWIKTTNKSWKATTLNSKASIKNSTLKESSMLFNNQEKIFDNLELDNTLQSITNKVFKDKQLNTWLLTQGKGTYKSVISNFKHFNNISNKIVGEITAVHKNDGDLWFTDAQRNLFLIDSLGTHFIRKNNFNTTTITTDIHNNLWFGTQRKGLYILRKQKDSFITTDFVVERLYTNNGLPNDHIQNIIIQKNIVWLITEKAGILKLDYNFEQNFVKKITAFNNSNGLKDLYITTSLLHNNKLWYGTLKGDLGYIDTNKITHFSRVLNSNTTISNIAFTDSKLYIGTLGEGIWSTTISNPKALKPINDSFLSSKNNFQLFIDSKNRLWNGTENGIDKIEFQNNTILKATHYNVNDGFIGIETTKNNIIEDTNGKIWFGTKNGITNYTSTENIKTPSTPTIHFETIEVSNQTIDSIQKHKINSVLKLNPAQNNISFSYKTVDINQPKRVEYQWVLNDNKSNWTTKNSIHFADLKGNYTFTVKSRNASKIESKEIFFTFFVDKPLHQKAWFIAVIIGLILIVFISFIVTYFKRKQLKSQQEIEKLTLENHLITLEQKALQLQMNPHFIFNVLNGIKAFGNNGNTKELNATISQFASLLRSLLQNSRKEEIYLSEEISSLENYLELEQKMSSNFDYEITNKIKQVSVEEILIPPMLIQPFIENSIKHGFKNSKGKLAIHFMATDKHLVCTIIDNGIGIEQSKKIKSTSTHNSIALKVTKERIENLSKTSKLEIKEISENNQINGTKVEFQIPLKTDY